MKPCTRWLILAAFLQAADAFSATFTVTNTDDAGPGSLRQAMLDAEADAAADVIVFSVPGDGPHTIDPLTQLPTTTQPVLIDGYTQPGASPNTLSNGFDAVMKISVVGTLGGGGQSTAFRLQNGTTIRGLAIVMQAQKTGVEFVAGGSSNTVAGCLIGIKWDGSAPGSAPSQRPSVGIRIRNSSGNQIGGLAPADRNVISHNFSHGVFIDGTSASNNVVRGNFIGTDFSGTAIRANFGNGVEVQDAPGNVIGGVEPGARNLISGNSSGVRIRGFGGARGNVVQGNYIGIAVTGTTALANTVGIEVEDAQETIIGGSMSGAGNLISGNAGLGVTISPTTSTGNIVQGNLVGVGVAGTALANSGGGIFISGSSNWIGGVLAGEGNVIAFNRGAGVSSSTFLPTQIAERNQIRGNSIHSNTNTTSSPFPLGIDLGGDGITPNDAGDADTGPNSRQNFPLLTSASGDGVTTTVEGTLNSMANQTYEIDFYGNTACDPSGNGEGQFYLGSVAVLTDGSGNGVFDADLPVASPGQFITATATDPFGNTSEFSTCFQATIAVPPMTFTVVNTNDAGAGSLRQAILDSNAHLSSENNTIAFDIPGAGLQTIPLLTALPAFVRPVTMDGFTQPGASANTLASGNNANWLIELRGVGSSFGERTLRLNLDGLIVRGLRLTGSAGKGLEMVSSHCVVAGCFIFSNNGGGIYINAANGNRIGGTDPADRNVISGNNGSVGVDVFFSNGNSVLGNFIGTDASGKAALGNQFKGVDLTTESSGNIIGGVVPGAANWIAFHESSGVSIQGGTNNPVRGNRLFSNGGVGIDLWFSGVTPNDVGDADAGPNHIQNFPILTDAVVNVGSTAVQGTLNSAASTAHTLDFYANAGCDASGHGEGEFYLGSAEVTTDGSGNAAFAVTIPATAPGGFITATATDPDGNTSEFSACRQATVNLPPQTFTVINANDSGPGSLRQAILDSALVGNLGADQIHFDIPGPGPHRINLLSSLPSPAAPLVIDGFTQPGASANSSSSNDNAVVKIQIDGAQMPFADALTLTNDNNLIRGLSFTRVSGTALRVQGMSNVIAGNWIGIDPAGLPAGNSGGGMLITRSFNLIGGTNAAARNIISANALRGVTINGAGASNNIVVGNYIGLGAAGTNELGNTGPGVYFGGNASWNTVGSLDSAAANYIMFNQGHGVAIESGRQNGVFINNIAANSGKNIRVAPGANDGVQPPVLTAAFTGSVTARGKHDGEPNATYLVMVWIEPISVSLFLPQGRTYLGSFQVTADGTGHTDFEHTFDFDTGEDRYEVGTNFHCLNNASEESNFVTLVPGGSADLNVAITGPTTGSAGDANIYIVTVRNDGPATATGVLTEVGVAPAMNILSTDATAGEVTMAHGVIELDVPMLAPGESVTLTFTGQPTQSATPIYMTARATSGQLDAFPFDNVADIDFYVAPVENAFDLSVQPMNIGIGVSGETSTWFITVASNGPGAAAGVKSYHYLPPGARPLISMTSTKGTCFPTATPPRCEVENLASGETYDVTIVFPVGDIAGSAFHTSVSPLDGDVAPGNNVGFYTVVLVEPMAKLPAVEIERHSDGSVRTAFTPRYFLENVGYAFETKSELADSWEAVPANEVMQESGTFYYAPPMTSPQRFVRVGQEAAPLPSIEVFQESLSLGFVDVPFSDHGHVELSYEGKSTTYYFNFAFEGQWPIRNIPIAQLETGEVEKISIRFPLGQYGVIVPSAVYGFSLTTDPVSVMPVATETHPVVPSVSILLNGIEHQYLSYWPAQPMIGGRMIDTARTKPAFPNREQGKNECAPAAILNSLECLNEVFDLNIPASELTMDQMKLACGWTPDGAPSGTDGQPATWVELKDQHMQARGLPIQTEFTTNIVAAMAALRNGYAVELWVYGHATVVREITELNEPGLYVLTLSDDRVQGEEGGTGKYKVVYSVSRGTVTGTTMNTFFIGFVIQSPSP